MEKMSKEELERWWGELGDVPVDGNDKMGLGFKIWPKGTDKLEIWHWFDEEYSKWGGVHALLYGGRK